MWTWHPTFESKLSAESHHLTSNADPWSEARHRHAHFADQLGGKHEQITPIISHSPGLQTPSVGNQVRRFIASDNIGSWGYQGRCRQQTLATLNIVSVWLIKSFTLKLSGKWAVPTRAGLPERGANTDISRQNEPICWLELDWDRMILFSWVLVLPFFVRKCQALVIHVTLICRLNLRNS